MRGPVHARPDPTDDPEKEPPNPGDSGENVETYGTDDTNPQDALFTPAVRARWRKVKKAILANPKAHRQWDYGSTTQKPASTAACLAGWFYHFTPQARRQEGEAASDMTLRSEMALTSVLAITTASGAHWPAPFNHRFAKATTDKQRAKVAAARIDHLLATGE